MALGRRVLGIVAVALLASLAWRVAQERPYTPGSDFGYALGVTGGSMMLALLLYPVRKHIPLMRHLGPLRHWFRVHMYLGVLGPTFIIFHTTFHFGSINAAVAFSCMALVACSGLVGRFLYSRIHRGLYGSRTTLEEARQDLARNLAGMETQLTWMPELKALLEAFATAAATIPEGRLGRLAHFLSLDRRRRHATRMARHALRVLTFGAPEPDTGRAGPSPAGLAELVANVDETFEAVQRTAQFATYERLFALWHVAHVPFVYLFVVTALVHVAAVHIY